MEKIKTPLTKEDLKDMKVGQQYLLSGIIYTARDKAHQKILQEKKLPINLKNQIIYYTGPIFNAKGEITSAGPTTSGRMDKYTKDFIKKTGIIAMIGKGERDNQAVKDMKGKAVYFSAIGGAGAYIARCIKKVEAVLYPELGPEAVYKLTVENLPITLIVDINANNLYNKII